MQGRDRGLRLAVDANIAPASATEPDRYDFVLKDEDTQGRYSMVDVVLSPTFDSTPGHRHQEHSETFSMMSGEMEWTVEGETQIPGPGDLVCIPPLAHHNARAVAGEAPRALLVWEPAGCEVGMVESVNLAPERRTDDGSMAEFRMRNDTYLSPEPTETGHLAAEDPKPTTDTCRALRPRILDSEVHRGKRCGSPMALCRGSACRGRS